MKFYKKITRFWKFFLIINLISLGCAALIANTSKQNIIVQDVYFNPPIADDWTRKDSSISIHGRLYLPPEFSPGSSYPAVILFHGVTRTIEDNNFLSKKLAEMGIVVFSASYRGHGKSGGTFPMTDGDKYDLCFRDALGAYGYVKTIPYIDQRRMISYGNSLGGAAAVFLALKDLVPKFVATFPALSYNMENSPIYLHKSRNTEFEGYIMAGTADACIWCLPQYVKEFARNNPSVEIHWLEGAIHTDSRFWLESMTHARSWIARKLQISEHSLFYDWYYSGYAGVSLAGVTGIIDLIVLGIKLARFRFKNRPLA